MSIIGTRIVAIAATLAAIGSLGACGGMKTANEVSGNVSSTANAKCPVEANKDYTGTVRVAWQAIPNADLIVKDQGLLEACLPNATVKWSQFNSGADVLQAFGSDSLDLGLIGSSPSVKAVSAPLNLPVKILWINDVIADAESLVTRDESAKTITDLKGKTIAVPFGSTSHFSLLTALHDAGLSESDVKLVNLDPDKMPAAWQRGEIDAAWVWDPVLSKLKDDGGSVITSSAETAKNGAATYDMELVTESFAQSNPEVVRTWTAVEDYAVKQLKADPAKQSEAIASQLGVEAKDVEQQLKGYQYLDAKEQKDVFHGELPNTLKSTADFLKTQNGIDQAKDSYADALYTDALDSVGQ